ncbi:MAG: hypothetical protein Kow00109_30580 [Acidobacteriota bacterium]
MNRPKGRWSPVPGCRWATWFATNDGGRLRRSGDTPPPKGELAANRGSEADPAPYALFIIALTLGYTWVLSPLWGPDRVLGGVVTGAGLLACLAFHVRHSRTSRAWGLSADALLAGLLWNALPTGFVGAASLAVGNLLQSIVWRERPAALFLFLLLWATAQQWALLTLVLAACRRRMRHPALAAGLIFGALHLPNPLLAVATALLGWYWCSVYLRYPNFLPAAVSHAACSFMVLNTLPRWLTGGMRIGAAWFGTLS